MRRQRLIAILQDVNAMYNYLPENAIRYISERLEVPVSEIYHIATFFTAFSLTPRGRHIIKVCMGTACHVRGSPRILSELERQLGIKAGETTPDKMFTLETVNCLGACALGPVIVIDEAYHTAQPARITKLLESAQTEPEGTVAATEAGV